MNIAYPDFAKELVALLAEDQKEVRAFSRQQYWHSGKNQKAAAAKTHLQQATRRRARRALQILEKIGLPSLSNIGADAAQALSILATHDSLGAAKRVLAAFQKCYAINRDNTYYQSIPAMTDWVLLLERKPQEFGCFWQFDSAKQPWLPTVRDFDTVNERREEYGIGPLRWPKSMAIPASEQPWLEHPLSELTMRDMTDKEYQELTQDFS